MTQSDFCICPLGSTSWTSRVFDSLIAGCIPVIISDDILLPWNDRVDWTRLALKWPQARVNELPTVLAGLSRGLLIGKRKAILQARQNMMWVGKDALALRQLIQSLSERKASWSGRTKPRNALEGSHALPSPSWWIQAAGDVPRCAAEQRSNSDALTMAAPQAHPQSRNLLIDAILVIKEIDCVVQTSLQALHQYIQPRLVHLITDDCAITERLQGADRIDLSSVKCIETDQIIPGFKPADMQRYLLKTGGKIPLKRQSWYYQQLVKLKLASSSFVARFVCMWDGDTIALRQFMPMLLSSGVSPLLFGTADNSAAYFKGGEIPRGYWKSTEKLLGKDGLPAPNISFVTQWQVWDRRQVTEMLKTIEDRVRSHVLKKPRWYKLILDAVPDGEEQLGFSEYTLYASWMLSRFPKQVTLYSSSTFLWLRDNPTGLLDHTGKCCPTLESLCALRTAGFHFVSWECSHASERR